MPSVPALRPRRELICQAVETALRSVLPNADHLFAWDLVTREPMSQRYLEHHHAVSVYDGTEATDALIANVTQKWITFTLEAQSLIPDDEDPQTGERVWNGSTWGNQVLYELQRAVLGEDPQSLGGSENLIINVLEEGCDIDLSEWDDKFVGVVLVIRVLYRHRLGDPRYHV